MAKIKTGKSRYPSLYSPSGWVSPSQYITELICERCAKSKGKDLPVKFWNLPDWKKYYKFQITICNRLLKKYLPKSIIAALKDDRGKRIYSLQAPWLEDLIQKHDKKQRAIKVKNTLPKSVDKPILNSNRPKFFRNKSILDTLRDIDNGKEENHKK